MELTFIKEPFTELTFTGNTLACNGLTPSTRFAIQYQHPVLYVTVVNDNATWEGLCEASQHNPTLGADWMRDNGQLVISGDWLTEIGITEAEHVDVANAQGIIIIRRRRNGILRV